MRNTLIGAVTVALGLSAFGVGCDDEREDVVELGEEAYGEDEILAEGPVADEMEGDELASNEPAADMPPAREEGGQGLATAGGTGAATGDQEMQERRIGMSSPEERQGAVGAATSTPADGSLRQVVERVKRELQDNDMQVVHSQPLRAGAPGGEGAAKPGEAPATRGELILFTQTAALEEALAVNPARALDVSSQLLVFESDGQVYLAFRTPEPGTRTYRPGYHGMHDSKPGEPAPAARSQTADIEAIAEAAARGEPQDRREQPAELAQMENEPAAGEENPFRRDTERDPERRGLR